MAIKLNFNSIFFRAQDNNFDFYVTFDANIYEDATE